ncbi:MAG: hypothetical protein MJA28_06230 [Gammaproteobacteria bacterium]|nr:hypothetical protein [Gammaproteobacteria bacterium]
MQIVGEGQGAKQISTAPPEKMPDVVRDGYTRIVNLASVIGKKNGD